MSDSTEHSPDDLREYLEHLHDQGVDRLVVRWTDESRPIVGPDDGVDVRHVQRLVLTAKLGDEAVQRTFEGVGYREAKPVIDSYPFRVLYRSENLNR